MFTTSPAALCMYRSITNIHGCLLGRAVFKYTSPMDCHVLCFTFSTVFAIGRCTALPNNVDVIECVYWSKRHVDYLYTTQCVMFIVYI